MEGRGFSITNTLDTEDILLNCDLIVTTTPSKTPLLRAENLQKGTHITAVGSDTPHKQELDSDILQKAGLVVADSISQCLERGEIFRGISNNKVEPESLVELGSIIAGKEKGRTTEEQITIADLTGVAVQDMQIAKAVFSSVK
jgi:ornithine cyclodeaminase